MMYTLHHILIVAGIGICLLLGWWFFWVPMLLWYAVYADAWWVVLVAVVVDGYYGAFYMIPYQSLLAFAIVLSMSYLRPHLLTRSA